MAQAFFKEAAKVVSPSHPLLVDNDNLVLLAAFLFTFLSIFRITLIFTFLHALVTFLCALVFFLDVLITSLAIFLYVLFIFLYPSFIFLYTLLRV